MEGHRALLGTAGASLFSSSTRAELGRQLEDRMPLGPRGPGDFVWIHVPVASGRRMFAALLFTCECMTTVSLLGGGDAVSLSTFQAVYIQINE